MKESTGRLYICTLALCLAFVSLAGAAFAVSAGGEGEAPSLFEYTIDDGKATVDRYIGDETEVEIPDELDGCPVVAIGRSAFHGCARIESIVIPGSVTFIGNSAFEGCVGLTSITLPPGLESVESFAFGNCTGLKAITIPDGTTSIGSFAFRECTALEEVILPDSVTSIGDGAFSRCSSLSSILLPDGLTTLGDWALYRCAALAELTLPGSLASIGGGALMGCAGLTQVTVAPENQRFVVEDGVLFDVSHNRLVAYLNFAQGNTYDIPEGTQSIGKAAFYECDRLTAITLPDSVTAIDTAAFHGCTGLTEIALPPGVTEIGNDAFRSCTGLTTINIPDGVARIDNCTFWGCISLTDIALPDSVTDINLFAFNDCTDLTRAILPHSVERIHDAAFSGCKNLTLMVADDSFAAHFAREHDIPYTVDPDLSFEKALQESPAQEESASGGGIVGVWKKAGGDLGSQTMIFTKDGRTAFDTMKGSYALVDGDETQGTMQCSFEELPGLAMMYDFSVDGDTLSFIAQEEILYNRAE